MNPKRLFVGNLAYSVNEEQLYGLFSRYGEVISVKIIDGKGYGFVEMESYDDAKKVRNALNETEFNGRNLLIDDVRPPKKRENTQYNSRKPFSRKDAGSFKKGSDNSRYGRSSDKGKKESSHSVNSKREKSSNSRERYPEKKLTSIERKNPGKENERPEIHKRKTVIKEDNKKKTSVRRLWPGDQKK